MKKQMLSTLFILLLVGPVLAANPDTDLAPQFSSDMMFQNHAGEMVPGVRCATVDHGHSVLPSGRFDEGMAMEKAIITIPVAFHILTYYSNRDRAVVGIVSEQQIADQMTVLNDAYLSHGFQFSLYSVDTTDNKKWATMRPGSRDEQACKSALAVDVANTLNIYSAYPGGGLLGWAYFPNSFAEDYFMHGVVIHFGSFPDGFAAPYNEGDTATHEVGHYLGLYHTFQGGCSEPNDYCDDTPQESTATFGCPDGQDSCTSDPGLDPIYNFMDYTDDYCMDHFTTDQASRMLQEMSLYRPSIMATKVRNTGYTNTGDSRLATLVKTQVTGISPNPFNPMTEISFYLDKTGSVRLDVYDVAGRLVSTLVDRTMDMGEHSVFFDGTGLSSSVYFMKLHTDTADITQRMMLIK